MVRKALAGGNTQPSEADVLLLFASKVDKDGLLMADGTKQHMQPLSFLILRPKDHPVEIPEQGQAIRIPLMLLLQLWTAAQMVQRPPEVLRDP